MKKDTEGMPRWCGTKRQGIFGSDSSSFHSPFPAWSFSLSFLVREPFDQRAHDLTGRFRVISNNDIKVVGTVFLDDALAYTAYAVAERRNREGRKTHQVCKYG